MIKEALQYITGLKAESMEPKLLEINGETYCTKDLTRYHRFPMASYLSVNTLTALVDYIKGKPEELRESSILHVVSPTKVFLFSGLIDERNRESLMAAGAIVNEFRFDDYYDQEYIRLTAALSEVSDQKAELQKKNLKCVSERFSGDWKSLYVRLDNEHKRAFWKQTIEEILVDPETRQIKDVKLLL